TYRRHPAAADRLVAIVRRTLYGAPLFYSQMRALRRVLCLLPSALSRLSRPKKGLALVVGDFRVVHGRRLRSAGRNPSSLRRQPHRLSLRCAAGFAGRSRGPDRSLPLLPATPADCPRKSRVSATALAVPWNLKSLARLSRSGEKGSRRLPA